MKVQYLITDHSHALAAVIIEMVRPAFREEELAELRGMLVEAVRGAIVSYEEKVARVASRIRPAQG